MDPVWIISLSIISVMSEDFNQTRITDTDLKLGAYSLVAPIVTERQTLAQVS